MSSPAPVLRGRAAYVDRESRSALLGDGVLIVQFSIFTTAICI